MRITNEEWIHPSRYRSVKRTECKRGKKTKRKRQGSAKTNPILQNKKEKV